MSKMLDLDMCIVFRDRDTGKVSQYQSGDSRNGHFTLQQALKELEDLKAFGKVAKSFDDDDYYRLKSTAVEQDDDPVETSISLLQKRTQSEQNIETPQLTVLDNTKM